MAADIESIPSDAHEAELVELACRGDGDAFGQLLQPYAADLLAKACSCLLDWNEAEEVLQKTLLKSWQSLGKLDYRGPQAFRGWLFRILDNKVKDAVRANSRLPLRGVDYGDPPQEPQEGLAEAENRNRIRDSVASCLDHLSNRERCVMTATMKGVATAQIQVDCDCKNEGQVYGALHRARAKMKSCLERKEL
ncbi:MAG: RNA polymerase sigma factor [Planctomycetota bacterium]